MSDNLLMGTARPLFKYGNNRYVLNDKPSMIEIPLPFLEEFRQNNGVFSPRKIFKHSDGFRPEVAVTWQYLDRPSVETLLNIFEQGEYFYMRPHFNFYKEYEMVCLNKGELTRIGTTANPYKGTLLFTGRETITDHEASKGAFSFDGTATVTDTSLASTINGDMTIEMWIKTPASMSSTKTIFTTSGTTPTWNVELYWYTVPIISFETDGHYINSSGGAFQFEPSTWYFLQIRRVSTDEKYILIDGVQVASGSDSKAANNVTGVQLGNTSSGFDGLCQILRVYNTGVGATYYPQHSIEAIDSTKLSDLKLWWDFSQGNANDLSGNNNDGTVVGATSSKESFPDNGQKYLT